MLQYNHINSFFETLFLCYVSQTIIIYLALLMSKSLVRP